MARMRTSHFLFLGYGMRDWNLRVILRHIWSEQTRHFASWAIQLAPERDRHAASGHGSVEIVDAPLEDWVDAMRAASRSERRRAGAEAARSDARRSPYQGLVPVHGGGRGLVLRPREWTEIVVDNLRAYRLSVLYGASGVGKSSLLTPASSGTSATRRARASTRRAFRSSSSSSARGARRRPASLR